MSSRRIFVATPTAGQVVRNAYLSTIVAFTKLCRDRGWDYDVTPHDSADVTLARNYLANLAMRTDGVTDLVFLDSDMRISAPAMTRMLDSGRPFVGAACPQRKIDLEAYATARARGHGEEGARALAMEYNLRIPGGSMSVKDGFAKVQAVGFGLAVIRIGLLTDMAEAGVAKTVPSGLLAQHGMGETIIDFFSPVSLPDGATLSEDYSFCHRLGQMQGGEVWAYMGQGIGHSGAVTFEAAYTARLRADMKDKDG